MSVILTVNRGRTRELVRRPSISTSPYSPRAELVGCSVVVDSTERPAHDFDPGFRRKKGGDKHVVRFVLLDRIHKDLEVSYEVLEVMNYSFVDFWAFEDELGTVRVGLRCVGCKAGYK